MADTGYFHLHLVSDATGETLITVARAAAAQYANVSPVEHLYPMVRSKRQLDHALAEISARHDASDPRDKEIARLHAKITASREKVAALG